MTTLNILILRLLPSPHLLLSQKKLSLGCEIFQAALIHNVIFRDYYHIVLIWNFKTSSFPHEPIFFLLLSGSWIFIPWWLYLRFCFSFLHAGKNGKSIWREKNVSYSIEKGKSINVGTNCQACLARKDDLRRHKLKFTYLTCTLPVISWPKSEVQCVLVKQI